MKWIETTSASMWCVKFAGQRDAAGAREAAAELIAWADEHDVVFVPVPRKTVEEYAGNRVGQRDFETMVKACREALK